MLSRKRLSINETIETGVSTEKGPGSLASHAWRSIVAT